MEVVELTVQYSQVDHLVRCARRRERWSSTPEWPVMWRP